MRKSRAKHIKDWAYKQVMTRAGVGKKEHLTPAQVVQVGKLYKEGKKQWLKK